MLDSYRCSEELRLKGLPKRELLYTTLTQIPREGRQLTRILGAVQCRTRVDAIGGAADEASEVR